MKKIYILFAVVLFSFAGKLSAQTWTTFGTGMNNYVCAMTYYNGELYAGGWFTSAGGTHVNYIARWNGTSWDSLGSGVDNHVWSLQVYNGLLYVGGWFQYAGGNYSPGIAVWDGSNWNSATGVSGGVYAMTVFHNKLFVGGDFYAAGGVPANNIAQWNGTAWDSVGAGTNGGFPYPEVDAMTIYNNRLIIGGQFTEVENQPTCFLAAWNDTTWSTFGTPPVAPYSSEGVLALGVYHSDLYAGGYFDTLCGNAINVLAEWNGTTWSAGATGLCPTCYIYALASDSTNLYVGKYSSIPGNYLGVWNDTSWSSLANGVNSEVLSILIYNNEIYAGGNFTHAGSISANSIAKWGAPTGIKENNPEMFSVSPNPSNGTFTIMQRKVLPGTQMEIYDVTGKKIFAAQLNAHKTQIDFSGNAAGLYFYRVVSKGEMIASGKLVIE